MKKAWRRVRAHPQFRIFAGLAALVVLFGLVSVVFTGLAANDLVSARRSLDEAKSAMQEPDVAGATKALKAADGSLRNAKSRMNSIFLAPLRIVPPVRGTAKAVVNLTDASREAIAGVEALLPIADRVEKADGIGGLTSIKWADFAGPVANTQGKIERAFAMSQRGSGWVPDVVARQRTKAIDQLASLLDAADRAKLGVDLFAKLFDGTERNVMVVIQNAADLRAAGGFPDQFVFLHIANGEVKVTGSYSDDPLPAGITPGTDWARSADSPDFSAAGAIWAKAVKGLVGGKEPDLVMGVDTNAIAGLMKATGEIAIEDIKVNADNYIKFSTDEIYRHFPDFAERQRFEDKFTEQFVEKLFSSENGAPSLAKALAPMIDRKHVQFFSPLAAVQADLRSLRVAGAIASGADLTIGAFATQNPNQVSKTYPWLERRLNYTVDVVDGEATVTADLAITNNSPVDLPDRVKGPSGGNFRCRIFLFGIDGNKGTAFDVDIKPNETFERQFHGTLDLATVTDLKIAVRNSPNLGRGVLSLRVLENGQPVPANRTDRRASQPIGPVTSGSDADYSFGLHH